MLSKSRKFCLIRCVAHFVRFHTRLMLDLTIAQIYCIQLTYLLIIHVAHLSATTMFQLHFQYEIMWMCMIDDDEKFNDVITQFPVL